MERDDANTFVDEAKHRAAAAAEKVKRAVEGDEMPITDRITSHVKEAAHEFAADVDKSARDLSTTHTP
jgi:hypothetical protein